jgi:ribose transport system permease protein
VRELRLLLAQNYGPLLALAVFVLMFAIYVGNHAAGLTVPVVTTAANKGVLLALVAMAQTLPILTGGLDLSVGMVFVLANCVASAIVVGSPLQAAFGIMVVLGIGALAGLINGCIVVYGACNRSSRRSRPAPSTTASRSGSGRSRAATCRRTSPTS